MIGKETGYLDRKTTLMRYVRIPHPSSPWREKRSGHQVPPSNIRSKRGWLGALDDRLTREGKKEVFSLLQSIRTSHQLPSTRGKTNAKRPRKTQKGEIGKGKHVLRLVPQMVYRKIAQSVLFIPCQSTFPSRLILSA